MKAFKKNRLIGFPVFVLSLPLLCGCNIFDLFGYFNSDAIDIRNNDNPLSHPITNDFNGFSKPESINGKCTFQSIGYNNEDPALPSVGDMKILVIPVEFSEYPFTTSVIKDIQTITSGTAQDTNYWESLGSYYSKSSYGNLNMSFVQMEKVNVGSVSAFTSGAESLSLLPGKALRKAIKQYKEANGTDSTKEFDSDGDGYIDAAIMIYSAPNYNNSQLTAKYDDLFWAYTYADYDTDEYPDVDSPIGWRYFWASYDFFYRATGTPSFHTGLDGHTLIHEAGHLFGTDDYYNSNRSERDIGEPSGGLMMMGWNVGDHDLFTKLSFGWTKPYVVENDCTIMIRPSQESGDCILLADSWNGTAFDEYILIDYYTPTGLSKLDAETVYTSYTGKARETAYRYSGIRVFHIDARLVYGAGFNSSRRFVAEGFLNDEEIESFDTFEKYSVYQGKRYRSSVMFANTNTMEYDSTLTYGKGYELIQLIQRGGVYTFGDGSPSTSSDLFQKGDRFSLSSHSDFFPRQNKFNNGDPLSFSFTIDDIGSDGAIISFKKS